MNWGSLRKGMTVRFYTASGWKKGTIAAVYENSCSVLWYVGSTEKITRVYDTRSIKFQ